jgi:hypothetical protein
MPHGTPTLITDNGAAKAVNRLAAQAGEEGGDRFRDARVRYALIRPGPGQPHTPWRWTV